MTRVQAKKILAQLVEAERGGNHWNGSNIVERDAAVKTAHETIFIININQRLVDAHFSYNMSTMRIKNIYAHFIQN